MKPLETPVAFIIFNRPDKTARVFEAIRHARPKQLFIIADGPRTDAEKVRTDAARTVTEQVDWDCEVKRRYSEKNLGVKKGPPTGISWVFEYAERCIFLEDDCLPDATFFPYCEELLERYKDDDRVMQIAGSSFQQDNTAFDCSESYYFSIIPNLWGWATWRRVWQKYDQEPMAAWPTVKDNGLLKEIIPNGAARKWWEVLFERNWAGRADTWEGPWLFAFITSRGFCAIPKTNLVTNIGYDPDASHWRKGLSTEDENANIPSTPLAFPLMHPSRTVINSQADEYSFKRQFNVNRYFGQKVRWFFRSRFPRSYRLLKQSLSHQ